MAWDRSLSEIPVPLLPGDDDGVLNLQHAFTYVYDLFNYEYLIDYSRPPKIPLSSETEQWMDHLLRSRGKR
jgi:hypothetical protein